MFGLTNDSGNILHYCMSNEYDNEVVSRRSGWSVFMQVIGYLAIILSFALGVLLYTLGMGLPLAIGTLLVLFFVGLQFVFSGFLVDVITDVRWFLQALKDNSETTNQYLDAEYRRNHG